MEGMKENKKRFFRKGAQSTSSRPQQQRSFDNHMTISSSSNCCRAPAPSPSIDNMSLASCSVTPLQYQQHHQMPLVVMSNPNLLLQQQQQQQQSGPQTGLPQRVQKSSNSSTISSSPSMTKGIHSPQTLKQLQLLSQASHSRGGGGGSSGSGAAASPINSASLDEAEINMNCHRRFMAAPRRARSAERFDGMRVSHNNHNNSEVASLSRQTTDDVLCRTYRSQQVLRALENNGILVPSSNGSVSASSSVMSTPGTVANRRMQLQQQQQPPLPPLPPAAGANGAKPMEYPVPSPPPSYTTAVNETRDPPPYHQAIAAGSLKQQAVRGKVVNNRYNVPTSVAVGHHHQSNSLTSTPTGNNHHQLHQGMRSVASTPIFQNVDQKCGCQKCQIAERMRMQDAGCGTEYNDAVYMESQAFLMHEIMTDGMAFCSIM